MGFAAGVGFANFDMLFSGIPRLPKEGEEIYAEHFETALGGGIATTLINLKRLNSDVRIVTFLGKDIYSAFIESELRRYGVEYVNVYEGNQIPVNITAAMITQKDRTFMSYHDPIEITAAQKNMILEQLQDADVIDMHEGFLDVYREIRRNGHAKFIFDTGWTEDMSVDKYREYLELADYYLPNQPEALKMTGTGTVEQAADVLGQFFDDVVIKLDKEGCFYKNMRTAETMVISPMRGVKAVDSTGAGDSFMSGFIYGLMHGAQIPECIAYGNVTGGACVQGVGCLTNYVTEPELLRKASEIRIEKKRLVSA
ncbi:MAG: carbohydrate kinase family protein [Lachnospiraceae bacterium]|nr:carbohydrate kinase family protein [Lachnospiraceae bacterium]